MRTHKNTHTHAPNVKTNNNGRRTLTPNTYSILPGPGADTPKGQPDPGGGPLPSRQPEPAQNSPNPPMNSDPNPMSTPPPMNPDLNFPTGPPPTGTQISNTCP
ncbi:hypothetical protein ILYODFUR_004009 [Ilyodon furcidens]|uniref:Uncharacterized protein n=1 Tax=Ilyodon furcidens TaxID=33524 RepID=A0ABV0TUN4_9TELE